MKIATIIIEFCGGTVKNRFLSDDGSAVRGE